MFNSKKFTTRVGLSVIGLVAVVSIASLSPASAQWSWLFGGRKPDVVLGTRGDICAIAPGRLEIDAKILSDRPLFSWQEKAVKLRVLDGKTELWKTDLSLQDDHVLYQGQTRLEPGKLYAWEVTPPPDAKSPGITPTPVKTRFKVLPQSDRDRITAELKAIEQKTKTSGSEESIADAKANYLFDQKLWSDAIRVLYEVKNPSKAFVEQRQQFVSGLCTKPETSLKN